MQLLAACQSQAPVPTTATIPEGTTSTIVQATQTPSVSINRLFTLAGNGTIDSSGSYGNVVAARTGNNASLIFTKA